jgi:acetyl-CoA acetyltransferase
VSTCIHVFTGPTRKVPDGPAVVNRTESAFAVSPLPFVPADRVMTDLDEPISLRSKAAIVGIGRTKSVRNSDIPLLKHISDALTDAVADAGLTAADVDGIMVNVHPEEAAMDKLPEVLGLPNIRWAFQSWRHGRIQPTCIAAAAWAVITGQADYVACMSIGQSLVAHRARTAGKGTGGLSSNPAEAFREGGGPHLEAPPYGMTTISGGAALAARKYMEKYGATEADLGHIAVAQRKWAQFNPDACFHGIPLTLEEYLSAPYIVEPFRAYDHCIPADAAFCIILSSASRAKDGPQRPVYLRGMQVSTSGRENFLFARTGLGVGQQTEGPYTAPPMPAYQMADIEPADVDILGAFDAFSSSVPFLLEEFGFCAEGEGMSFIASGRTEPGGDLPVNTGGGGLSDVESYGWGHEVDMVRQLRGHAGAAQVPDAEICQYSCLDHSTVILSTDP